MSYSPPSNPRIASLDKPSKAVPDTCSRCGGAGGYNGWPGWTCFRCGGSGRDPSHKVWAFPSDWTDSQIETFHTEREARNARARERAQAKRTAEIASRRNEAQTYNFTTYPELAPIFERTFSDPFVSDIIRKGRDFPLTEAQATAVIKAVAEYDAKTARIEATPDLPEGALTIVGRIVSTKWVDSQWGGQLKMLVELDTGQRVFGTCPAALDYPDAGVRVRFDATVERSADDRLFGFYKRPRNAVVLERSDG